METRQYRSMILGDREMVLARVSLEDLLAMEGFDLTQPYRIRALSNGTHQVSQYSVSPLPWLPEETLSHV